MGFTEIIFFFLFLPVSIIVYLLVDRFISSGKAKNIVLILLSLGFYYWASKQSLVLFLSIVVFSYLAGLAIGNEKKEKKKLGFAVCGLVGALLFFKYAAFVTRWINQIVEKDIIRLGSFVVPIGISFVVFEAVSYVVDIYRGDAPAGSFLDCLTFFSLFPKLVSGPIVLWKDFQGQIHNRKSSLEKTSLGLERIIIGYAKKVIIADTLGLQISLISNGLASGGADWPSMWLKALLYFFQIYYDFSGYSDIAIGLAEVFGFSFKENFSHPYLSQSISEFWRRWHISLGTWFREYVYIPLGGNRKGNVYLNLFVVFLLTGIWHGSGWTFLIWGGFHGICVVFERRMREKEWYKKTPAFFKWVVTMFVVFLTWILFMSSGLPDAQKNFMGLFQSLATEHMTFTWRYYLSSRTIILLVISMLYELSGLEFVQKKLQMFETHKMVIIGKKVFLIVLLVIDMLFVINSTYHPFIYFQF